KTLLQKGKDALTQKPDEAVQAFAEAVRLVPDSKEARDLLTQATEAARKKTEQDRTERLGKALEQFRTALAKKDFDTAATALGLAARIGPTDPGVVQAQQDLTDARKAAAATDAKLKQAREDYQLAMDAGKAALKNQNYEGAVNSFKEALRLMPADGE